MSRTEAPVALAIPENNFKNVYKYLLHIAFIAVVFASCKTVKKINTAIAPKDSVLISSQVHIADSSEFAAGVMQSLDNNNITAQTFSAKIKVEVTDAQGKQPDITAVVRMIKDSAIWMSLTATFLNFEFYRVLITKDSVMLLNKREKEVQYRSLNYLQEITSVPFNLTTLQDFLLGNPIFFDSNTVAVKKIPGFILLSSVMEEFKNLLTLSDDHKYLVHCKLDDVDVFRNRTADITYDNYSMIDGEWFSFKRQLLVSEKTKLNLKMEYKQVEFNKDLSVGLKVPRNYSIK